MKQKSTPPTASIFSLSDGPGAELASAFINARSPREFATLLDAVQSGQLSPARAIYAWRCWRDLNVKCKPLDALETMAHWIVSRRLIKVEPSLPNVPSTGDLTHCDSTETNGNKGALRKRLVAIRLLGERMQNPYEGQGHPPYSYFVPAIELRDALAELPPGMDPGRVISSYLGAVGETYGLVDGVRTSTISDSIRRLFATVATQEINSLISANMVKLAQDERLTDVEIGFQSEKTAAILQRVFWLPSDLEVEWRGLEHIKIIAAIDPKGNAPCLTSLMMETWVDLVEISTGDALLGLKFFAFRPLLGMTPPEDNDESMETFLAQFACSMMKFFEHPGEQNEEHLQTIYQKLPKLRPKAVIDLLRFVSRQYSHEVLSWGEVLTLLPPLKNQLVNLARLVPSDHVLEMGWTDYRDIVKEFEFLYGRANRYGMGWVYDLAEGAYGENHGTSSMLLACADWRRSEPSFNDRWTPYSAAYNSAIQQGWPELASAFVAFFAFRESFLYDGTARLPWKDLDSWFRDSINLPGGDRVYFCLCLLRDATKPFGPSLDTLCLDAILSSGKQIEAPQTGQLVQLFQSRTVVRHRVETLVGQHVFGRLSPLAQSCLVDAEQKWSLLHVGVGTGVDDWGGLVVDYVKTMEIDLKAALKPVIESPIYVTWSDLKPKGEVTLGQLLYLLQRYRQLPKNLASIIDDTEITLQHNPLLVSRLRGAVDLRNKAGHSSQIDAATFVRLRHDLFSGGLLANFIDHVHPTITGT